MKNRISPPPIFGSLRLIEFNLNVYKNIKSLSIPENFYQLKKWAFSCGKSVKLMINLKQLAVPNCSNVYL